MGPTLHVFFFSLWLLDPAQGMQVDPDAALRAQQIVSATKPGQEQQIPCTRLEGVGQALLDLGREAAAHPGDRGLVALRLAVQSARCTGSQLLLGNALRELSIAAENEAPASALPPAEESVAVLRDIDNPPALASSLNRLGNVYWWLSRSDEALDAFQRSLDISTRIGDRSMAARTDNNIANVLKVRGEYAEALDHLTRSLTAFEALDDRPRAAIVLNNIALVHSYWGDNATALEYSGRALALGRAAGDQNVIAKALDTIAEFYRQAGAYDRALESFQEALRIRTALDQKAGIVETTHNIGLVYFSQGEYELAIAAFRRALRLDREWKTVDDAVEAEGYRNLGAAAWRLGQPERAAADFRESLAVVRRTGNRYREAQVLDDVGQLALAERRSVEASRSFERSLAIRRALGDQAGVCQSLTSMAAARLLEGRARDALDLAKEALASDVIRDRPDLLWPAQTAAARAQRRLGRTAEAKVLLGEAIQAIEHIKVGAPGGEGLGLHFLDDRLQPYHELIAIAAQRHEFEDAFNVAERSRARVLTSLLRAGGNEDAKLLTDAEKRERGRLRDAVTVLNSQIAKEHERAGVDPVRIEALESRRREARDAVDTFETVLASRHPQLVSVAAAPPPPTLAEAGRVVADRATAVLEYVVAEGALYALLLERDGTRVAVDGRLIRVDRAALTRRVERFSTEIASRDYGFASDARAMYDLLVAPFGARLAGVRRLIIVPDGVLWRLPFQALRGPGGFLVEQAAISYAPSIAVLWQTERTPSSSRGRTVLAMAKTTFASPALEPLPEAANQVRMIRDIYGAARAAVFVDGAATESRFKNDAPHYGVLHLATHGVLEEASPLYSHLVLTPSDDGTIEDGRLEAREIMRLKLTAELVVLAACDTGRGGVAPGEGVIGTTWALLAAGARSMVVSQFRVEARSTTALLVGFHRRLAAGSGSKAEALRASELDLLHTPRFAHPYYWAGFMLVGDPE